MMEKTFATTHLCPLDEGLQHFSLLATAAKTAEVHTSQILAGGTAFQPLRASDGIQMPNPILSSCAMV